MPPTPTKRQNSKSTTSKSTTPRKKAATTTAPAVTEAPVTTTEGAIGSSAKLSSQGNALLIEIKRVAKPREVTLVDYGGGNEVLVKVNGTTACYLIQKNGSTDVTARYRQKGLNLKGIGSQMTIKDAAKAIVEHLDARPPRATRSATPAAAAAPAATKTGNGKKSNGQKGKQSLANGLREEVGKTAARARPRARSRSRQS